MFSSILSLLTLTLSISQCLSAPNSITTRAKKEPLMPENFPDPSILQVNNRFYTFSTEVPGAHIPIAASSNSLSSMSFLKTPAGSLLDAMPALPPWVQPAAPAIWAPDVIQLKPNLFILYFSAAPKKSIHQHCIGAATSSVVAGPYTPAPEPLACPLKEGGAIDPDAFLDTDNTLYLTYKIDGNSLGGGGPCGNADRGHDTPIMLQRLSSSDGISSIDDPVPILHRGVFDGPLIEAPSLMRSKEGLYVLFFSSNCYNTEFYDTSYATSRDIRGPYEKAKEPLLKTGVEGLYAPGGADVLAGGGGIVFHATERGREGLYRQMYSAGIRVEGSTVSLA